jgi:hypothetical protein
VSSSAAPIPIATPAAPSLNARDTTARRTVAGDAPSVMRTPISWRLCPTSTASTP